MPQGNGIPIKKLIGPRLTIDIKTRIGKSVFRKDLKSNGNKSQYRNIVSINKDRKEK